MRICITGTPGTGKSSVAKILAKKLNLELIDVKKLVKAISIGLDRKRSCYIIDESKINLALKDKDNFILASHFSHFLKDVDYLFVFRTDIKELKKRLEKRKWPKRKINENLQAEIFDVILIEAKKLHKNVFEIETTNLSAKETAEKILAIIKNK